jgi:hypothetical protein
MQLFRGSDEVSRITEGSLMDMVFFMAVLVSSLSPRAAI